MGEVFAGRETYVAINCWAYVLLVPTAVTIFFVGEGRHFHLSDVQALPILLGPSVWGISLYLFRYENGFANILGFLIHILSVIMAALTILLFVMNPHGPFLQWFIR